MGSEKRQACRGRRLPSTAVLGGWRPGTPAAEACFPETSGRRPQEPRLASNSVAQQRRGCCVLRQGRRGCVLFSQRSARCSPLERAPTTWSSLQGWGSYDSLPQAAPAAVSSRTDAGWICLECHWATLRLSDTHTHRAEHPPTPRLQGPWGCSRGSPPRWPVLHAVWTAEVWGFWGIRWEALKLSMGPCLRECPLFPGHLLTGHDATSISSKPDTEGVDSLCLPHDGAGARRLPKHRPAFWGRPWKPRLS